MLMRLFLLRLGPFVCLHFCRDRKKTRNVFLVIAFIYSLLFGVAVWKIFSQEQWKGIVYLPISLLPHYLCYGFAVWLLIRCIWSAWSERVWKRIYGIAMISVIAGIYLENYWNPRILQFFCNFFN